jgi:hypothetical protein
MVNRWSKTKMEEKKEYKSSAGKIKIVLGSLSILTVFFTPYLNITQISFNMNLFQSAMYSLILFSFWIFAAQLIHKPQQTHEKKIFPDEKTYDHRHRQPMASI